MSLQAHTPESKLKRLANALLFGLLVMLVYVLIIIHFGGHT
jgi:hypothetical protein